MKTENNHTSNNTAYLNYVVNVLRFDVMTFLREAHIMLQELQSADVKSTDISSQLKKIAGSTAKSTTAVRDSLALLTYLTNQENNTEISLNRTLDNAIKDIYFEVKSGKKEVSVSYSPAETDILIQCDELILHAVINNIFYLAWEQITDSKVVFSSSYESGFSTITLKYKGRKHEMMDPSSDKNEDTNDVSSLTEFNNPYTLLKIMEKIGLGVLSFSNRENFNIINFTLHLITRESETPKTGKEATLQEHNWDDKTVLIVDDIEVNYIFLETILADTRVKTLYASNGKIAVDMCRQNKNIDAVLMDIKMPVMDGYEATKLIKADNPELPVIIQTAYSFNEEYERCKELGCSDYITKPLKSENVISVLAKYFIA